jgi:putative hemolysin
LAACVFFSTASIKAEERNNIPNPAAAYVAKLGYKYEISTEGKGMVIFPDGTKADEWDFFRGKARQEWSYCQQHGGKIENRSEDMGTWTSEYAVCIFTNGSQCRESDYIAGTCSPAK